MRTTTRILVGLTVGLALAAGIGYIVPGSSSTLPGLFLVGTFAALALAAPGIPALKDLAYTIWIFAAVTLAMIFPQAFIRVGDFQLKRLIVPLIQVIMFGMGAKMSMQDFVRVAKDPKGVAVGLLCQFTIMPFVGYFLASTLGFEPAIAAGVVLIGCAPSGLASNVIAYIAGANLALSIAVTTVATLLAPVLTPLLMKLLAGQFIEIDVLAMMLDVTKMIIVPVAFGLVVNRLFVGKIGWLDRVLPIISMVGIATIIVVITASGREYLLNVGPLLVGAAMIHNASGYLLGYWGARLFRLDEASCRTVAIEVGMQNGGLASGIAIQLGREATMGLAAAVFGPWMNISGSVLANWWRRKPIEERKEVEAVA